MNQVRMGDSGTYNLGVPRLGIVGYARSGTRLVQDVLKRFAEQSLNEALNPVPNRSLTEMEGGRGIFMMAHDKRSEPQSREERFRLVQKYEDIPYHVKLFGFDLAHPGVVDWLRKVNYKFVAVERHDILDNVLSGLVALEHDKWNIRSYESRPEYHEFVAPRPDVIGITAGIRTYYETKPQFQDMIHATIRYEDLQAFTKRTDIIQASGLPELYGARLVDDRPLPTKKLLTKQQKMDLITNMEEVVQWVRAEGFTADENTA